MTFPYKFIRLTPQLTLSIRGGCYPRTLAQRRAPALGLHSELGLNYRQDCSSWDSWISSSPHFARYHYNHLPILMASADDQRVLIVGAGERLQCSSQTE
jgi:hypothetical protein